MFNVSNSGLLLAPDSPLPSPASARRLGDPLTLWRDTHSTMAECSLPLEAESPRDAFFLREESDRVLPSFETLCVCPCKVGCDCTPSTASDIGIQSQTGTLASTQDVFPHLQKDVNRSLCLCSWQSCVAKVMGMFGAKALSTRSAQFCTFSRRVYGLVLIKCSAEVQATFQGILASLSYLVQNRLGIASSDEASLASFLEGRRWRTRAWRAALNSMGSRCPTRNTVPCDSLTVRSLPVAERVLNGFGLALQRCAKQDDYA